MAATSLSKATIFCPDRSTSSAGGTVSGTTVFTPLFNIMPLPKWGRTDLGERLAVNTPLLRPRQNRDTRLLVHKSKHCDEIESPGVAQRSRRGSSNRSERLRYRPK